MNEQNQLQNRINKDLCKVRVIHLERVLYAKQQAIPFKELEVMSMMYKMLGDPTRLKILMALRDNEMCVCDLAAFTGLTESAVSHQLRRLRDLALVKKRREGQVLYYSLDDKHVEELLKIGLTHVRE
ncbi:MAG: winged helix-turn-helix transcriptional regulator [Deltaproteobacteria bacterium]|nr:winged helix-turn-helix transcriptional regulator [Deltaproteobacteria bacterium]